MTARQRPARPRMGVGRGLKVEGCRLKAVAARWPAPASFPSVTRHIPAHGDLRKECVSQRAAGRDCAKTNPGEDPCISKSSNHEFPKGIRPTPYLRFIQGISPCQDSAERSRVSQVLTRSSSLVSGNGLNPVTAAGSNDAANWLPADRRIRRTASRWSSHCSTSSGPSWPAR